MTTTVSTSEIELMQRIYEYDNEAVKELYKKYSSILYTLVKKILKDEELTEKILADVFIITQKKINYFDFNSRNTYTWLITLAKNLAVYELRKKEGIIKNLPAKPEEEFIIPRLSHLSESLSLEKAVEYKKNIEDALNKLTDGQQYVIYHGYYEGLIQEIIAEKLKIPYSTIEVKVRTSLINLNENFKGKSSLFTVKNEVVEMIYPYVLGCLGYKDQIKTYERFKTSEPFPWKLLGEYQNLVSLLPVILDFEVPAEDVQTRIIEKIENSRHKEEKVRSFERVTLLTSNENEDSSSGSKQEENLTEEKKKEKIETGKYEPVLPFKPSDERSEIKRKNFSPVVIISLIALLIISLVLAYLFYKDRTLYYESQIENLTGRVESLNSEIQNRSEIPGLDDLKNPQIVELENANGAISSGRIIFSYTDKRGYLHINNLPILDSDNAYQLWGKFNGDFISLGVFKVSSRPDYYPFTLPEFIKEEAIEFFLIESNAEGSRRPGSKVYLRGTSE